MSTDILAMFQVLKGGKDFWQPIARGAFHNLFVWSSELSQVVPKKVLEAMALCVLGCKFREVYDVHEI